MKIISEYLSIIYHPDRFHTIIERTISAAYQMMMDVPYDTIAFTGTSGAAMAFVLSKELGMPLLCVRKKSEKSHYSGNHYLEGNFGTQNYIIVDDMIDTGTTFRGIVDQIKIVVPKAKCVGALMYASYSAPHEYHGAHVRGVLNS